jgi:hypothetical protein
MTLFLVGALLLVGVWVVSIFRSAPYGRNETIVLGGFVLVLVIGIFAVLMDAFYYGHQAFPQATACELRRMEARRQVLSSTVVCIPAYRGTKNDTLTVQGVGKP